MVGETKIKIMAMLFKIDDQWHMFIHIPKTGGCAIEKFLLSLNIECIPSIIFHPKGCDIRHFPMWKLNKLEISFTSSFISVRHPIQWYESWWKSMKTEEKNDKNFNEGLKMAIKVVRGTASNFDTIWHPLKPIIRCHDSNFNKFIENCIQKEPAFVTRMYECFCGPQDLLQIDNIVRQEFLQEDMDKLVKKMGYSANINLMDNVNVSGKFDINWEPSLKKTIQELEFPTINRFYKGEL